MRRDESFQQVRSADAFHAVHDDIAGLVTSARLSQADRRARTRAALVQAAAEGVSRNGYTKLVLEQVANEAGYSRGALYHQFANKEELALEVVKWVEETLYQEADHRLATDADPVGTLLAAARDYPFYIRNGVSGALITLRAEFGGTDHPVGRAVNRVVSRVVDDVSRLITTPCWLRWQLWGCLASRPQRADG